MDRRLIYSDFFDRYLKGKLSKSEKAAFEEKAAKDPLLQSELRLQKEIYAALGEERRSMLKSRLEQVPVNGTGWMAAQGTKLAAAIGSVLLVATGSYYYLNKVRTGEEEPQAVHIEETYRPAEAGPSGNALSVPQPSVTPEQEPAVAVALPAKKSVRKPEPKVKHEEIIPEARQPELHMPAEEENQQINYGDFEVPEKHIVGGTASENTGIDVETTANSIYQFHYRFANHKLFLYGEFGDTLYKIIALKDMTATRHFLEYKGAFYNIDETQKEIAPLQAIEDTAVIHALQKVSFNR